MKLSILYISVLISMVSWSQNKTIDETPEQYLEHVQNTWDVDGSKIVYISDQTSLFRLATTMHESMLSFVAGELSTSADILDGRNKQNKKVCGLVLNNLDLDHVRNYLKKGRNYSKIKFKRLLDNSEYNFDSQRITSVLLYTKKLDYFMGDYFEVLKQFNTQDVDYIIVVLDNEITTQIPGALSQGGVSL